MKKIKLSGKLELNKETITNLNNAQMNLYKGGDFNGDFQNVFTAKYCPSNVFCPPTHTEDSLCPTNYNCPTERFCPKTQ